MTKNTQEIVQDEIDNGHFFYGGELATWNLFPEGLEIKFDGESPGLIDLAELKRQEEARQHNEYQAKVAPVIEYVRKLTNDCKRLRDETTGLRGLLNRVNGSYKGLSNSLQISESELADARAELDSLQSKYGTKITIDKIAAA